MCTYLHGPREGGMYYFRRSVPAPLRPIIGQREWFFSLDTKDRAEAKEKIWAEAARTGSLLKEAKAELAQRRVATAPPASKTAAEIEQERRQWEHEEAHLALQMQEAFEHAALVDEADALEERLGRPHEELTPDERAAALLLRHLTEQRDGYRSRYRRRKRKDDASGVAGDSLGAKMVPSLPGVPVSAFASQRPSESKSGATSITGLFELYGAQDGIAPATVRHWRSIIRHLVAFLSHDDAQHVTPQDLVRWREHLRTERTRAGKPLSAKTINGSYLAAANVTFAYGLNQLLLSENPMTGVQPVRADKKAKLRESDFTKEEQKTILKAALVPAEGRLSPERALARRWVPWLCAYTGARVNEMTQLRAEDVFEKDGHWVLRITPEAGNVKTNAARVVPIHEHLIEQGFLVMAKGGQDGPLFYNPDRARGGDDGRHHKKVGMFLAGFHVGNLRQHGKDDFTNALGDTRAACTCREAAAPHRRCQSPPEHTPEPIGPAGQGRDVRGQASDTSRPSTRSGSWCACTAGNRLCMPSHRALPLPSRSSCTANPSPRRYAIASPTPPDAPKSG